MNLENELKSVIRGILVSSPTAMTVRQLDVDFKKTEGAEFPFKKFGSDNFLDYLRSIPDTVVVSLM